ncbi:MAG: hypothetical protein AAFX10_09120, partial [Pseudomonadota bacterium]
MAETSDTGTTGNVRLRKPREGTRNRGAVDALQTKIAVSLQNLDAVRRDDTLRTCIDDLPDAAGVDVAMLCFLSEDGRSIESVFDAKVGFARSTPEVLIGEYLGDWPVLMRRLGHLRAIEVDNTGDTTALSRAEADRLRELHIGAALIVGFAVHGEMVGFLALDVEPV